jgi:hypothetical protein
VLTEPGVVAVPENILVAYQAPHIQSLLASSIFDALHVGISTEAINHGEHVGVLVRTQDRFPVIGVSFLWQMECGREWLGKNCSPSAKDDLLRGCLPTGFTATFSPGSLAAGSGTTTVTLTVQVPQTAMLEKSGQSGGRLPFVALCILLLPFAGTIRRSRTWFRRIAVVVIMLAGAGSATTLIGCGGGGSSSGESGSQPQSYTLTVTATSGALSHSTTVTLTVQ